MCVFFSRRVQRNPHTHFLLRAYVILIGYKLVFICDESYTYTSNHNTEKGVGTVLGNRCYVCCTHQTQDDNELSIDRGSHFVVAFSLNIGSFFMFCRKHPDRWTSGAELSVTFTSNLGQSKIFLPGLESRAHKALI